MNYFPSSINMSFWNQTQSRVFLSLPISFFPTRWWWWRQLWRKNAKIYYSKSRKGECRADWIARGVNQLIWNRLRLIKVGWISLFVWIVWSQLSFYEQAKRLTKKGDRSWKIVIHGLSYNLSFNLSTIFESVRFSWV